MTTRTRRAPRDELLPLTAVLDEIGITRATGYRWRNRGYGPQVVRLPKNPIPAVRWKPPERAEEVVDPACVPDPRKAVALLSSVREQGARGKRLVAFFGCIHYAAARPGELIGLRVQDCRLPRRGWGLLRLRESRARSGTAWTDTGEAHDRRGLKHRPRKTVRAVPISPQLVAMLRWHITAYGTGADGRLFRTARGGMVQESGYGEVWARARADALSPAEQETRLAKPPYDLRHAAVSTWLSSGVEPQLVAERAGHSVAVLFRVYAKFLKGGDEAANAKIAARLRDGRSSPPSGA
ncbi:hypothetical protein PV392_10595 [Streptomyces sp. ME03-5709C]|nr:hypothetical protein [Streptomyces sp. ME03-5709C]